MMISISVVTIKHELYISRFSLLYTYAVSLLVVILIFVVGKSLDLRRVFRRKQEHSQNSRANYQPLLRL